MKILDNSGTLLVDLGGASLHGANLCNADLRGANLCSADLGGANLYGANLHGADLRGADLCNANLRGANLCGASLCNADLYGVNLCNADLCGANLRGANLHGADLGGAKLPHHRLCPDGAFTAWKKVGGYVIELLVPAEAARVGGLLGRKCRCEFARVINITPPAPAGVTTRGTTYRTGEMVHPDRWDDDIQLECTHGIHFFITREEAEGW